MKKTRFFYALMLVCALSAVFIAPARNAGAVLGGSADSIGNDVSAMKAAGSKVKNLKGYSVHEIDSGTLTLREYVSPDGVVFGIAWDGLLSPKLSGLLGSYYNRYREARRQLQRTHGKKSMRVQADDVVVEKWGHMRSMHGRAYVPSLVPAGVSADVVR